MAVITTLAACNTNPALNGPDGSDLPSTLDDAMRYALSFIAQLRDGAAMPIGQVASFACIDPPAGWVRLNGTLLNRTTYAALWAFAQASGNLLPEATWFAGPYYGAFSTGDGSTNFRIPDMRGLVVRGFSFGAAGTPDPDGFTRGIGSFQDSAVLFHNHGINDPTHSHGVNDPTHTHGASSDVQGAHQHTYNASTNSLSLGPGAATAALMTGPNATSSDGAHSHGITVAGSATGISVQSAGTGISVQSAGLAESRGRNVALAFCMKY